MKVTRLENYAESWVLEEGLRVGMKEYLHAIECDLIKLAFWICPTIAGAARRLVIAPETLRHKATYLQIKEEEALDIIKRLLLERARLKARVRYIETFLGPEILHQKTLSQDR